MSTSGKQPPQSFFDIRHVLWRKELFMTEITSTTLQQPRDIQSLRLPQNYAETIGVKKVLTNVPVGKPSNTRFFQTHPDAQMEFPTLIYQDKKSNDTFLVYPELANVLERLARPVVLHVAVDRQGNPSFIPVFLPDEGGSRNPWHESMAQAVILSKGQWVRINANRDNGAYDVKVAVGDLPPPKLIILNPLLLFVAKIVPRAMSSTKVKSRL
jgi:hypothetical protein